MDRRLIRKRIGHLSKELKQVVKHRRYRGRSAAKIMFGCMHCRLYECGKSTLLNLYTDAGVLEEDQLFATLDPTTRSVKLPCGQENFTDGYGRLYPKNSASSCECVSKYFGRGKVQRSDPACRRCIKSAEGKTDADSL